MGIVAGLLARGSTVAGTRTGAIVPTGRAWHVQSVSASQRPPRKHDGAVTRRSAQFAGGLLLGFVASFAIALSLIAAVAAVVVVVVVGLVMPRFAALAGGLIGVGGTWLVLLLNSLRICAGTEDFCGNANYVPWLAISTGLVLAGAVLALWTMVAARHAGEP